MTTAQIQALIDAWVETYIKQDVSFRTGQIPTAERLNELFNLLIDQADGTVETTKNIIAYIKQYRIERAADDLALQNYMDGILADMQADNNMTVNEVITLKNQMQDNLEQTAASIDPYVTQVHNDAAAVASDKLAVQNLVVETQHNADNIMSQANTTANLVSELFNSTHNIEDEVTAKPYFLGSANGEAFLEELDPAAAPPDAQNVAETLANLDANKLDKTGASNNNTVTFSEAATDTDIVSGSTHTVIFGQILKTLKTLRTTLSNLVTTVGNNKTASDDALATKAAKSTSVAGTLLATNWVGTTAPYTIQLAVAGVTATNNVFFDLAMGVTLEQYNAAADALLKATAQTNGTVTISAFDTKPTIDIPVQFMILG